MSPKLYGSVALLVIVIVVQLSVAVALTKVTPVALHVAGSVFTVISSGHAITGSILSEIVTEQLSEAELPASSVTVRDTIVVPMSSQSKIISKEVSVVEQLSVLFPPKLFSAKVTDPFSSRISSTDSGQIATGN